MPPNNPYQNQTGEPVSLPPVLSTAGQSQAVPTQAVQPVQPSATVTDTTVRAVADAEHLVKQYINDPFQMSEALGQLKASYLAEHYQINLNKQSAEH
jgi:hypothetical protein